MNSYTIIYYSGTGCTKIVAACLENALKERGCVVVTERITAGKSIELSSEKTLILLFPVHAYTDPGPVFEWLRGIDSVSGKPAAVCSISGGGEVSPNTACRGRAVKMLSRKGYDVFREDSIVMPSNSAVATPEPMATMLIKALPEKIEAVCDGIVSGERKVLPTIFIDRVFAWEGRALRHGARLWGRVNKVSSECDGCGICAGACSSVNITMVDSRPKFGKNCCLCFGCFYACPKGALSPRAASFALVKDFDLEKLQENALISEHADVENIKVGTIWLGVKEYLKK